MWGCGGAAASRTQAGRLGCGAVLLEGGAVVGGTEDAVGVTGDVDGAAEPFGHGELVAELVVVDDAAVVELDHSLMKDGGADEYYVRCYSAHGYFLGEGVLFRGADGNGTLWDWDCGRTLDGGAV